MYKMFLCVFLCCVLMGINAYPCCYRDAWTSCAAPEPCCSSCQTTNFCSNPCAYETPCNYRRTTCETCECNASPCQCNSSPCQYNASPCQYNASPCQCNSSPNQYCGNSCDCLKCAVGFPEVEYPIPVMEMNCGCYRSNWC